MRVTRLLVTNSNPDTQNSPQDDLPRAVLAGSGGRIRTYDLWVMSGHAAVSHRPTHTTDVPRDQPTGDAAVSALPPGTTT